MMKVKKSISGDNISYVISLNEDTNTIKAFSISETEGSTELILENNTLIINLAETLTNISSILISIAEYKDTLMVDRYTEILSVDDYISSNFSKEDIVERTDLDMMETKATMFIPIGTGYDEGFIEGLLIGTVIDRNF